MRVLWITNILFPEAENAITGKGELKDSGGWLIGCANELIKKEGIQLSVAAVSPLVNKLQRLEVGKILYYVIPLGHGNIRYNRDYEKYWSLINKEYCPDIVHIHGTEFAHGLAFVKACGGKNVIVSIQGLLSSCYKYYAYGLTSWQIIKNIALRDLFRGSIFHQRSGFRKRSVLEIDLLNSVNHIIGRTSWDKAHVWAINPKAEYHFCNEILRTEFYNGAKWQYDKCQRYSIFISQAGYPLKGLHQVLKALPLVLKDFPGTQIYVAGKNVILRDHIKDYIYYDGYGRIVNELLETLSLKDHVHFIGYLNANQMIERFLKSNVFISPSSIENSPNSLGEAQILGVPCISSYVGGAMDMIPNENCGLLYRFEDTELLASRICNVFVNSPKFDNTEMRDVANNRHNRDKIINTLLDIYNFVEKR